MKEKTFFNDLRAHVVFVVAMILLFACGCEDPYDLPPVKPVVVIKPADSIKMTSATMVALVVPNEDGTQVSFELESTGSGNWQTRTLPLTYSGQDTVKLTSDLSDLVAGTEYGFRVKASNAAGEVVSDISTFCTYAIVDVDGNLYHTVKIGNQVWLKENLKVTHYANGEPIPNVTDPEAWGNLTTGAFCWYNNDPKIGEVYGGLYNWYTVADPRGLAIKGWHVPTDKEWCDLETFLGGQRESGPKMMETGLALWKNPLVQATNSSGFTALPNGAIAVSPVTGKFVFMNLGEDAIFWTSELFGPGAEAVGISISHYCILEIGLIYTQNRGFGIRLIKDAE